MTLQQLTYFLAAAEHGSFSAAAGELQHGPAVPLRAGPPARGRARRRALRARRPRLELTEAGRLLRPQAERTLAAAARRPSRSREVRDAHRRHRLLRHVRQRALLPARRTSSRTSASRTRTSGCGGRPELLRGRRRGTRGPARGRADRAADRRPRARRAPALRRGAPLPHARTPRRARADDDRAPRRRAADPLRRALRLERPDPPPAAERAQRAGREGSSPRSRSSTSRALDLAARGLGDTIGARGIALGRAAGPAPAGVGFDPPLYDTFAFITRRNAHLSPATRAFMALAEKRIEMLGRGREPDTMAACPHDKRPSPRRSTSRPSSGCRRRGCR